MLTPVLLASWLMRRQVRIGRAAKASQVPAPLLTHPLSRLAIPVYNCLCNLLVDAVSESNPRRKDFIGLIMKMDKSAQKSLMKIIKDGKHDSVRVDLVWEVGGVVTPRKHGGSRSSRSSPYTPHGRDTPRRLEAIIKELKREKAEVEGKLKDQANHNQQLSQELAEASEMGSKAALSLEIATLEKYENLDKEQKTKIAALTEETSLLRSKVKTFDQLKQQVLALTDELDILKHSSAKLPSLEKSLESYKEKLENFDAVKLQLQDEQKAHASAIDKLIKLENENSAIPNLKKQLETYKKKSSDLSVANETLTHELNTLKKLSSAVQKQNAQLSTTTSMQLKEAQELQKLLVESYGGDDDFAMAVGEGVSELNPKIAEEVRVDAQIKLAAVPRLTPFDRHCPPPRSPLSVRCPPALSPEER